MSPSIQRIPMQGPEGTHLPSLGGPDGCMHEPSGLLAGFQRHREGVAWGGDPQRGRRGFDSHALILLLPRQFPGVDR